MRDVTSPETLLDETIAEHGGYASADPTEVAGVILSQKSKSTTMYLLTLGVRARMSALRYKPRHGNSKQPRGATSQNLLDAAKRMGDLLNKWVLSNGVALSHATRPMLLAEIARNKADNAVLEMVVSRLENDEVKVGSVMGLADIMEMVNGLKQPE